MDSGAADRIAFPLLIVLMLVAFVFGGGGIGAGLANLMVQLTAIAVLALRRDGFVRFWRDSPLALRILIAASLALPLVQIIPLPESMWSALPGRELVIRSMELVGGAGWMPHSVNPLRTLLALTALITPLAVLVAGWTLPRERLIDLGWGVAGLGLVTLLLGAIQLGAATDSATFYGTRRPGAILLGTFANRNSTGLLLTFALGLAELLPAPRPHPAVLPARLALCALLLIAVVITQSRTALVLALIPLLLGSARALSWMLRERQGPQARRGVMITVGAIALIAAGAGALLVAAPGRINATLERFEGAEDDPRRFIWDDATYSVGRYWPAGAGMGTFDEIYQVDESLENLTERRAGRVHNDFIELAIEAGAPGLALAALWLVLISWLSWRARGSSQRWAAWAGSAFLFAIALQSITDYPLRNQTILAFAGFALLLLTRIAADGARGQR
jgi:exopolysaccharide production protein ExoQ